MNKQELSALVAEIMQTLDEPMAKGVYTPKSPGPQPANTPAQDADLVQDITELNLRNLYLVENPVKEAEFRRLKERTPARLGNGRAGARYKTLTMLRFRADHAAAQDAVFSMLPEDFG